MKSVFIFHLFIRCFPFLATFIYTIQKLNKFSKLCTIKKDIGCKTPTSYRSSTRASLLLLRSSCGPSFIHRYSILFPIQVTFLIITIIITNIDFPSTILPLHLCFPLHPLRSLFFI